MLRLLAKELHGETIYVDGGAGGFWGENLVGKTTRASSRGDSTADY